MSMYKVIGTNNPTCLAAKAKDGERIAIDLTPGKGEIARGTVLFREENGMYSPAAAADAVITKDLVILDETVDTGAEAADGAIAPAARAYRKGHFVPGTVKLKNGAALTEAVMLVLRVQGMVFDPVVSTAEYDNTVAAAEETEPSGT